jgi:colanic acid/amylovoran biosynthesis glycosyltransferase
MMKVAYIMSRFPKITETFILYEMLAVEEQGVQVSIYPLLRPRPTSIHPEGASLFKKILERMSRSKGELLMHPEAVSLVKRAHYAPFFSFRILADQLYYLVRRPLNYLGTLWSLLRENWGSPNYLLGSLAVFPKTVHFARLMETEGIQHVHAHFANHPAAAAYIVHRLTGIPYSFTAHGADLQVDQHMLCEKISRASAVITISKYNKTFIGDKCGTGQAAKVHVIYCGVDTRVFTPRHETLGPSKQTPRECLSILAIGTFYEVKGHTYLIEACRLLREQGLDFTCQLVGDGPLRETLVEQVSQSGLKEQVSFHGQLTRQEIVRMLQAADVLVVPSVPTLEGRREGIPVVLMEAMASGVPVVASHISGIPELVEDGVSGLLVEPRQPEALAAALSSLYKNPGQWKRLSVGGRDRVVNGFDLTRNADRLVQTFRNGRGT